MSIISACCNDIDILMVDLLFPDNLSEDGKHFVNAHGLGNVGLADLLRGAIDMGDGMVKIKHRCEQLGDNGECKIYKSRPNICRNFDCSTRSDCSCKGSGKCIT